MNTAMLTELADNAEMLLALSVIYEIGFLLFRHHQRIRPMINGLLISMIGVLIMANPFVLVPGLMFDTRTILISLTALIFGYIPTVIVVLITSAYRAVLGGVGTLPGIATILTSAAIGLLARRRIIKRKLDHRWLRIYGFGILVHLAMLACQMFLPYPLNINTVRQLALPVMFIYPVVTVVIAILLVAQNDRNLSLIQAAEAEARYRSLFENNHAPMLIIDPYNGSIVDTNTAAVRFYGWTQDRLRQMNIAEINTLSPADIHAEMEKSISEKRSHFLFEHRRADGSQVPVEVYSGPITINSRKMLYSIVHDISDRRRLEKEREQFEAQIRQQQKLEAIGTLAGGVAHEINNPIFGIMNYAQLVLDDLEPATPAAPPASALTAPVAPPASALAAITAPTATPVAPPASTLAMIHTESINYLHGIVDESRRVSEIVKSLLQFSRQDKQSHSFARVEDIISQTVSLVRTLIRKDAIELSLTIPAGLPSLKCRSQQIQQVLMNLLTNARDALNEKYPDTDPDKVIFIRCSTYQKIDRGWICIEVEDHGVGIPESVRQKMFEPFFSTKPKEKGTGLGLSISFGIVQDHHGHFDVDSVPGERTVIRLHLPVDNGWEHGPLTALTSGNYAASAHAHAAAILSSTSPDHQK